MPDETRIIRLRPEDVFYTLVADCEAAEVDTPFIQVFWTWAATVDEAIHQVLEAASREGLSRCYPSAIDPYDVETLPEGVYCLEDTGVFTTGSRFLFPADSREGIDLPPGVILAATDGENEPEDIREAFSVDPPEEDGLLRGTCVVSADKLVQTFMALVAALPSIRVSWVQLHEEWEDAGVSTFYANEECNSVDAVRGFLADHEDSVVRNGKVLFTVYSQIGSTNLVLGDHKDIGISTYDERVLTTFAATLEERGFPRTDTVRSIRWGFHHYHYMPVSVPGRADFAASLEQAGFRLWKEIAGGTAEDQ